MSLYLLHNNPFDSLCSPAFRSFQFHFCVILYKISHYIDRCQFDTLKSNSSDGIFIVLLLSDIEQRSIPVCFH